MSRRDAAALSGSPDEPSLPGKAVELRKAGDFRGAIAAWRQASTDPEPLIRATALWQVGTIFLEEFGDARSAIPPLRQAWETRHPEVGPLAALDLARAYGDVQETARAREVLQWVWELNHPRFSSFAALPLSRLLFDSGETEEARRILKEVTGDPDVSRAAFAHRILGDIDGAVGNLAAAQTEYELALRMEVEDAPHVRFALARIQDKRGQAQAACTNYEAALAEGIDHPANVRYVLASLQARLGAWPQAMRNYELAWQAGDDEFDAGLPDIRPSAAGMLAHLYRKTGDIPAARRAAEYAAEKGSDRVAARAMHFLASLDAREGNGSAARAGFNRALKKAAGKIDLPETRLALANLDEREGQLNEALSGYSQLTVFDNQKVAAAANFGKGRVLAKLGDHAGARAAYEAAFRGPLSERLHEAVSQHLKALDQKQGPERPTSLSGDASLDDVADSTE